MAQFYSINALWSPEQSAMEGVALMMIASPEDLTSKDNSLLFILQAFIEAVCITT